MPSKVLPAKVLSASSAPPPVAARSLPPTPTSPFTPTAVVGAGGSIMGADGIALDNANVHAMRMKFTIDFAGAKDPLQLLGNLAKAIRACREVGIAWDEILCASDPHASGARLSQLLSDQRANPNILTSAAKHFSTPDRLPILAHVDEQYRAKLKELVVARVLKAFAPPATSTASGLPTAASAAAGPSSSIGAGACNKSASATTTGVSHAATMLVALVTHDLLPMDVVAKLLDQQMRQQDKSAMRSAVTVLGLLSERFYKNDHFLKAISHLQPLLQRESANDPSLDYDASFVSRVLGWNLPGPQLRLLRRFPSTHSKAVVSSTYFSVTDDLVTGGLEGSIAVWGAANADSDGPSARFTLPPSYVPAAMDGFTRGRVLAVACVAPAPNTPMIRLYQCADSDPTATNWKLVETIERDDCTVITCLKRINLKTNAFVAAEADGRSHNLVCFNMQGRVQRQVIGAHKDHTTVLQPSADFGWLFSGSRDTLVKAWDARNFGGTTPLHTLAAHTDTITGICATADHVLTSGLDNKVCLWDIRRLKRPVAERTFAAPVLRVSVCGSQRPSIVVSTTQSLTLLSFTNLIVDDVVSNTSYTDLRPNHDGSVMFATGANGVDMYMSDPQN